MKKVFCTILALILAAALIGCRKHNNGKPFVTEKPETTQGNSADPASTGGADEVTAAPTIDPEAYDPEADAKFAALDLEIFREIVTSSTDTYNQFIVSDPGKFGIDPNEVNRGWGDLT